MSTRVYVGRLSYDVRETDLEKFFKGYGRIREILLKNGFGFIEFDDHRDAEDAVHELNGRELLGERITVEKARGMPFGGGGGGGGGGSGGGDRGGGGDSQGRNRFSNWSNRGPPQQRRRMNMGNGRDKYGPPTRTEHRLIVKNLSSSVSWQDLKDYMRKAGEVTYADSHKQHRNEGVVEFASYSDMKTALEKLDDTDLNGRRIKLEEDKSGGTRRRRSRSRSRSGSHSKSRSRSRSRSYNKSSRSRSKSKSHSRERSKSHDKGSSKADSRSRSRSPPPGKDRSPSPKPRMDDE